MHEKVGQMMAWLDLPLNQRPQLITGKSRDRVYSLVMLK